MYPESPLPFHIKNLVRYMALGSLNMVQNKNSAKMGGRQGGPPSSLKGRLPEGFGFQGSALEARDPNVDK